MRDKRRPLLLTVLEASALVAIAGCGAPLAGTGGAGGEASTATTTTAKSSTTNATTSTTKQASSSSGVAFVCDPPAAPGSLYEKGAPLQFEVEPTSMCLYRGEVLLIVNTASA